MWLTPSEYRSHGEFNGGLLDSYVSKTEACQSAKLIETGDFDSREKELNCKSQDYDEPAGPPDKVEVSLSRHRGAHHLSRGSPTTHLILVTDTC